MNEFYTRYKNLFYALSMAFLGVLETQKNPQNSFLQVFFFVLAISFIGSFIEQRTQRPLVKKTARIISAAGLVAIAAAFGFIVYKFFQG